MLKSSLACFAFLALAAGCTVDTETTGASGKVTFSYQSSQCSLFGCGLDQSALQGSIVTILTSGGDASLRPTAKLATGSVGQVTSQTETCACQTGGPNSTSRAIDPTATCTSNETKSCNMALEISTTAAGDDTLEIHEPSGALRDSVAFHVRAASHIDFQVSNDAGQLVPTSGAYTVHVGDAVKLHSDVYDSANQRLIFSESGLSFAYADKGLLQPASFVLLGATDIEYMTPIKAGDTSVVDSADSATASVTVQFHIVP